MMEMRTSLCRAGVGNAGQVCKVGEYIGGMMGLGC